MKFLFLLGFCCSSSTQKRGGEEDEGRRKRSRRERPQTFACLLERKQVESFFLILNFLIEIVSGLDCSVFQTRKRKVFVVCLFLIIHF
ncbi:hypothetical protein RchiOBHm_Chr7g0221841 [Rosa chinensis]|uniref:Uncharacterized protein n=1 Tax=Rosa chinensis TaxID=74649 RepID=A0A2P6PD50_ROSCH|nr:hypothetical protein RchiOBHm_Chr7g0221841 [Rosa chinensis]